MSGLRRHRNRRRRRAANPRTRVGRATRFRLVRHPGPPARRESAGCRSAAGSRHGSPRSRGPAGRPLAPRRRQARVPCVKPGARDLQRAAQQPDRERGLLRDDEREPRGCSFAKKAVALECRAPSATASGIPLAPHQQRPARDAAYALERGGVVSGQGRVQEGARAAERDPARGLVQLACGQRCERGTHRQSVNENCECYELDRLPKLCGRGSAVHPDVLAWSARAFVAAGINL